MKYLIIVIIIISFCVSSNNVLAQQQESSNSALPEDVIELLENIEQIQNSNDNLISQTHQIGNNNSVEIFSTQQNMIAANIVAIGQFGDNNQGFVNQNGTNQEIGIFQNGNLNIANVAMTGDNIYNSITQVGTGNYVKHDIDNTNSATQKTINTEQYGDENKVILETGAMDYANIDIVQQGNNNNAELNFTNMGTYTDPYSITQMGDESEIVVSQSAFYMPMKTYGEK